MGNKAREINSPVIKQLLDETTPEELAKIDTEMTNNKELTSIHFDDQKMGNINNKQRTAVEFYLDKIFDIIGDAILDKLSIEQINKIHDLSLQAKEMEIAGKEMSYSDGYAQGYQRALDYISMSIENAKALISTEII